jgi:hypothetical protein
MELDRQCHLNPGSRNRIASPASGLSWASGDAKDERQIAKKQAAGSVGHGNAGLGQWRHGSWTARKGAQTIDHPLTPLGPV